ncbi:MAG: hypothetical protein GXP49_10125 [Deltaproteobacteria bacterium]|nr:hypothetical protein [Deltaproteobacteria bacterium]
MVRSTAVLLGMLLVFSEMPATHAAISARYGGVLKVALPGIPFYMDPAHIMTLSDRIAVSLMFETLFSIGPDNEPRPSLVYDYSVSDDQMEYTFHLKPFLEFQDSGRLTADDVIYTFKRLLSPKRPSEYAWLLFSIKGAKAYNEKKAASIEGLQKINDITFKVVLSKPDNSFLKKLAALPTAIVPFGIDYRRSAFGRRPLGCGPFEFAGFLEQGGVALRAWTGHFKGRPFLDRVELVPPGKKPVDISLDHSARVLPRTSIIESKPWRLVILEPGDRLDLSKPGLRQAMFSLLERRSLAERFGRGRTRAVMGLDPFKDSRIFNPMTSTAAAARIIAAEVPSKIVILARKNPTERTGLAQAIARAMERAGLHVEVDSEDPLGFIRVLNLKLFDFMIKSVDPFIQDPVLEQEQLAGDYRARSIEELTSSLSFFPLFYESTSIEFSQRLMGLHMRQDGTLNLEDVWIAPDIQDKKADGEK